MRIKLIHVLPVLFLAAFSSAYTFGQKLKPEDILLKHLDSLGSAEARAAASNWIIVGDASARFISTKDQTVQGRIVIASDGNKNFLGLNMNSSSYPGERFSFNGRDPYVAPVTTNNRSVLGNFLQSNTYLLEDSLLGGTLERSWVAQNPNAKSSLSGGGIKKVDGRECYVLDYMRKNSDLDITLYFDKETFRHVRTEYKRSSSAGIGTRPEQSSQFSETRYKVVEDFSDFQIDKGLTLPRKYRLTYLVTGGQGTTEIEWTFSLNEFAFNQKIEPSTFEPSK